MPSSDVGLTIRSTAVHRRRLDARLCPELITVDAERTSQTLSSLFRPLLRPPSFSRQLLLFPILWSHQRRSGSCARYRPSPAACSSCTATLRPCGIFDPSCNSAYIPHIITSVLLSSIQRTRSTRRSSPQTILVLHSRSFHTSQRPHRRASHIGFIALLTAFGHTIGHCRLSTSVSCK